MNFNVNPICINSKYSGQGRWQAQMNGWARSIGKHNKSIHAEILYFGYETFIVPSIQSFCIISYWHNLYHSISSTILKIYRKLAPITLPRKVFIYIGKQTFIVWIQQMAREWVILLSLVCHSLVSTKRKKKENYS